MLRRDFLTATSLALGAAAYRAALAAPPQTMKSVLDYGARPDGRTMCTDAIQRAIDDAFQAGGGIVSFPAGKFLTGRIDLKSHVGLYLGPGSTLLGSKSIGDYHGAPGSADYSQKHLIYARDAEDVSITGPGHIDGQGPAFWEPSDKPPLPPEEQWADVASHALKEKKTGRPSPMIRFANCRKVRIDGVQIESSPGWTLHMLNCDDVQVQSIAIRNPVNGPNTDGIDITGCQNVTVSNCSISTGDDAICLKSENPMGGEPRLVRNIVVSNCRLTTCCNGFKLGTSSEGGFENVSFTNSVIHNDDVSFGERVISGIALEVIDGGWIDGVTVTGIRMERTRTPIFIRLGNRKRVHDYQQHGLRNVRIDNIDATEALLASSITGIAGDNVQGVSLSNIRVDSALVSRPEWVGRLVPEKDSAYPEARMFGMLPASGLYARHARDLTLDSITLTAPAGEARPAVIFDDVDGARLSRFATSTIKGSLPVILLENTRNITIAQSAAPANSAAFLGVSGSQSANVQLVDDDLRGARQPVEITKDVSPDAVKLTHKQAARQ